LPPTLTVALEADVEDRVQASEGMRAVDRGERRLEKTLETLKKGTKHP